MKKRLKILTILLSSFILLNPGFSFADVAQTSSSSYQLSEVFFGSGGQLHACSTNYCAKQSAGEVAVGNSKSSNYQTQAGFNTNREPFIQVIVSNNTTNLGTLSPNTTATATASFSVSTYLAHGYAVVNGSPPPTNGGYQLHNLPSPSSSQAGVEQFGINLEANTSPINFGANPSSTPSSGAFSYGVVDSNYDTANQYMYSQGSTIALSTQSTSFTNYTISYIFNISHTTPGGSYIFDHVLIVTSTY